MRQTISAVVLVVAVAVSLSARQGPARPANPVDVLLFVDDLHLAFRETPRARELMTALVARGMRPGDRWSVATTGASSVSQSPTTDQRLITSAISRTTGNGLTLPQSLSDANEVAADPERRHRSAVAFSTAVAAIEALTPSPTRSQAIVYVSNGHDQGVADPSALVSAAQQRRVSIHVLDPRDAAWPDLPVSQQDAWNAYLAATRRSLIILASQTGGVSAFGPYELTGLLAALERAAR